MLPLVSLGATSKNWEASGFYAHAFEAAVNGFHNFDGANADLRMSQDTFGVSVGWIF